MLHAHRIALAVFLASPLVRAEDALPREEPIVSAGSDGARKVVAVEATPLGLFLGHYGASVEVVPVPHHGLTASAYYMRVESYAEGVLKTGTPPNVYSGVGGELGYRYYFGALGPHGLYLGPSLLVGGYQASVSGQSIVYHNIGGAMDIGYQSILGPMVLGLGMGLQYVHVDRDLPPTRDLYTEVTVHSALRPRVALTIGYGW